MLKKALFLTIAVLLIGVGVALFVIAPYHIYTLTLTEGVSTRFLGMKPSAPVFYDGRDFEFYKTNKEDEKLFTQFHFSNFVLPLPLNHPIYSLIPTIKIEGPLIRLGGNFLDGKNAELFSFIVEKNYKLEMTSGDQKLFLLPIFKNYIARKSPAEIWTDLFSKKLSLPSNVGKSFFQSLVALREVTYSDLVYNLYILYNRAHIFPQNITRISFNPKTSQGLIEFQSDDPHYKIERLYLVEKGIIYSLTMKTKIDNISAESFRYRFLTDISYKASNLDSAIPIYAQYKGITYNNRIDQQGMTYLFSAWSHDSGNKEYIRVIILFLERGKSNLKYLKPFYEYAYKKFGSSLSAENNLLMESVDEKLKRKVKEELEAEVKKEESKARAQFEGNFSSPEEKMKYYLQKAKESKMNSDDTQKVLIEE